MADLMLVYTDGVHLSLRAHKFPQMRNGRVVEIACSHMREWQCTEA